MEHKGRNIVIRTTYEIKIDGQAYQGHAKVDGHGRIHCHAIPYDTYPSAVEFVKQLVDLYPESFPPKDCGTQTSQVANEAREMKT